ncbi:MAG: energy-coupling factor transporter transmembrane component T [Tissierellia bacterium]|nr:energy-coupling factor transporter transmembrane component T [Tissierellia bacterium]
MLKDFDPRLKILLAVFISHSSFSLVTNFGLIINYALMLVLFIGIGAYKHAFKIGIYIVACFFLNYFLLGKYHIYPKLKFFNIAIIFIIKFSIIGIMILWISLKMKSGHFIAAMEAMHLPKEITIILAVVLRFFPTLKSELDNIKDAMKLRNIEFNLKNMIRRPAKTIEFAGIPLIMRSMTLSEGLSAAAMCRGLDLDKRSSSYIPLKLKYNQIVFTILILFFGIINIYLDKTFYLNGVSI